MDRKLWKSLMTDTTAPPWPCPACKAGCLKLVPDSLGHYETRISINTRASHAEGYWEPDIPFYRFRCTLQCDRPECTEPVIVTGHTTDEQEDNYEGGIDWKHYLSPVCFHPPPPVIPIPGQCPPAIKREIQAAFALYWCDRGACANRLRAAIERLLTHLKVPRTSLDKDKHERHRLSLHGRIKRFEAKDRELATAMYAVKWLGNEGSHTGKLQQDDLLDAFELTHHLLSALFIPPDKNRVIELAKAIHRRKKPRSQHRPRPQRRPAQQ